MKNKTLFTVLLMLSFSVVAYGADLGQAPGSEVENQGQKMQPAPI